MKKLFLFILLLLSTSIFAKPTIHVIQVVPIEYGTYTVEDQNKQISKAVKLAKNKYFTNHTCNVDVKTTFKIGDANELYKTIKEVCAQKDTKHILGFSRSVFARLAAKAAHSKNITGLSIGASANDLKKINNNFYSIASDQKIQWKGILSLLKKNKCDATNTLGVFQETDSYSFNFKNFYLSNGYKHSVSVLSDLDHSDKFIRTSKCFFMGLNVAASNKIMKKIVGLKKQGLVVTSADWSYYSKEIKRLTNNKSSDLNLFVPKSCYNNNSKNMSELIRNFESWPDCVVPMTYDAMLVSLHKVCDKKSFEEYSSKDFEEMGLVKAYQGISETGNFISQYKFDQY